jgi:hypothetical protein
MSGATVMKVAVESKKIEISQTDFLFFQRIFFLKTSLTNCCAGGMFLVVAVRATIGGFGFWPISLWNTRNVFLI